MIKLKMLQIYGIQKEIKIFFKSSEYFLYKILPLSSFEQRIFGQTFLLSLQRPANIQGMDQYNVFKMYYDNDYDYEWNILILK